MLFGGRSRAVHPSRLERRRLPRFKDSSTGRRGNPSGPGSLLAESIRAKTNLGVAIAALFILSPFAVNNLMRDRLLMGAGSLAIVLILITNAWFILRGRMVSWLTPLALVPAILGFLVMCFRNSYPALRPQPVPAAQIIPVTATNAVRTKLFIRSSPLLLLPGRRATARSYLRRARR